MEAALATDDPRLQSTLAGTTLTPVRSRTLLAMGAVLLGVIVLFSGLIAKVTLIGVAGFVIALFGVATFLRGLSAPQARPKAARKRSSLSDRLEERWNRRNM
jgi:type IV secretory pathway TrbD component